MCDYTYYGDLLGIGNYYKLGENVALRILNDFYNLSFRKLAGLRNRDPECKIMLFSDSLIITGSDVYAALEQLNQLYSELLDNNLLLRGAIVKGRLEFQERFTIENFEKRLPVDDTLARAAGLEKSHKGARLIIENSLAEDIFSSYEQWSTHEGYLANIDYHPENEEILRKICPTPDNINYELLYHVHANLKDYQQVIKKTRNNLIHLMKMGGEDARIQYKETIGLTRRCEGRLKLKHKEDLK